MLNDRQIKVLNFLIEYISINQFPPSVREIQAKVGIKSTSTVNSDLNKLNNLGYIKKNNQMSRSIEILKDANGDSTHKEGTLR